MENQELTRHQINGRERLDRERKALGIKLVTCPICGREFRRLGSHVSQVHGLSALEFRHKYGFKHREMTTDEHKAHMRQIITTPANGQVGVKTRFKKGQPHDFKPVLQGRANRGLKVWGKSL